MRRLHDTALRVLITCSALLLLSLLFVSSASAHAHLVSSNPSDGEVLTAEPATVSAVYDQETSLTKTTFDVYFAKDTSATPQMVSQGKVDVNQRTNVSATLPPGLGDGVYSVKWHTLTEDDNGQVDGTFSFTVASVQTASGPTGKTGNQQELTTTTGTTTGSLPTTGSPDDLPWQLALVAGLALLGGGLVLRRRYGASR
jgi:LPXTG-motif cell wall-anchored protein